MKKRKLRIVTTITLSLMLVFAMVPGAVFASEGIDVKLTVKNDTFTSPLINDAGVLRTPKWTGLLLDEYTLTVDSDQSLADAMLSCGAISIVDHGSSEASYFTGFNGLEARLGLKHSSWRLVYDTTGWIFSVNGMSAMAGPSGYLNQDSVDAGNYEVKLNEGDEIVYSYTVDGSETEKAYIPSAPANLKSSAVGYNKISLSWVSVNSAQGYAVYRSDSIDGNYKKIGTSEGSSYVDNTAVLNKTYFYKVAAGKSANLQNESDFSNLTSVKTSLDKPSIKVAKKGKKSLKVSWKKVDGAKQYEIYRATSKNGKYKKIKTVSSKKTSYTNSKLKKGKKYYYKIKAVTKVEGKKVSSSFSNKKGLKR